MEVVDQSMPAAFQAGHAGSIPVARSTVPAQVGGVISTPLVIVMRRVSGCVPAACPIGRIAQQPAHARRDLLVSFPGRMLIDQGSA